MKKDDTIFLIYTSTNIIDPKRIKYYWSKEHYTKITNITNDYPENYHYGDAAINMDNKIAQGKYYLIKKKDDSYNTLIIFFNSTSYNDIQIFHKNYIPAGKILIIVFSIFFFIIVCIRFGLLYCYKYKILFFEKEIHSEEKLLNKENKEFSNTPSNDTPYGIIKYY